MQLVTREMVLVESTNQMSSEPTVEVLLATYNGERFLRQQIDSILAQDYENLCILARDDGSSDRTADILEEYSDRFPNRFRVISDGIPTGSAKLNFLLLMKASTESYICFSDQDDVWLPGKVRLTMQAMEELILRWGTKPPLLVFTDLQLVGDRLNLLHASFWSFLGIDPDRIDRLPELLGKSVVTGCTAMLNRSLLDLALRMPEDAAMHDRWIALLACILGKSSFIRGQTVLYRQHDRNVIGTGQNLLHQGDEMPAISLWQRYRRFRRYQRSYVAEWKLCQRQAAALLRVHGAELPPKQRDLLMAYRRCETSKSRVVRLATLLRHGFYFVGLPRNLATVLHLLRSDRS